MKTPKLEFTGPLDQAQAKEACDRVTADLLPVITDQLDQVRMVIFRGDMGVTEHLTGRLTTVLDRVAPNGHKRPKLQAVAGMHQQQGCQVTESIEAGDTQAIIDETGNIAALLIAGDPLVGKRMVASLTTWIDRVEARRELPPSNPERPRYAIGDRILFHPYTSFSDRLCIGRIVSVEWGDRLAAPLIWHDRKTHTGQVSENVYTIEHDGREHFRSESELLLPSAAEIDQVERFCDWLSYLEDGDQVEAQITDKSGRCKSTITGRLRRGGPRGTYRDFPNVTAADGTVASACSSYDLLLGPNGEKPLSI